MTSSWDPSHYLRYGDERTRPFVDLAAAVKLGEPQVIVDLGCGPGNSTQVLRARWPDANLIGIDSSHQMIASAETSNVTLLGLLKISVAGSLESQSISCFRMLPCNGFRIMLRC
ncbi:MAG: methyltransferase domain-containing protein [Planctomycetaceae bacterium]|nr:methyltransferase domain-containing protein [Planctomycetaceae bacterium]